MTHKRLSTLQLLNVRVMCLINLITQFADAKSRN